MSKSNGRESLVPRKLQVGDAVVFKFLPQALLTWDDQDRGYKRDKWIKATIKAQTTDGWIGVVNEQGFTFAFQIKEAIIIRSTALKDSAVTKAAEARRQEKAKAQRELAEIQKQARRQSLGRYGSSK